MKKKVSLVIIMMFLSFTLITSAKSNVSIFSNNFLLNSNSKISTSETAWTDNGTEISVMANYQEEVAICSDGAGGAIIAWQDYRSGSNYDIYAQRVRADGNVAWTTGGVAICTQTSVQLYPKICSDGAGGAIIAWQDFRGGSFDIYAQKIIASGVVTWTGNGVVVCAVAITNEQYPELCSDGAGGAIITWQDERSGLNIYAQRVLSSTGVSNWTPNGILVASSSGAYPEICSDEAGGAVMTWEIGDIFAQRVNSTGNLQWSASGVTVCNATDSQSNPKLVNDGSGGAIIAWEDHRNNPVYEIYARRVTAAGAPQWADDGEVICTTSSGSPQICSDGGGGAIIAYVKSSDISVQRINSAGTVQWTPNGENICVAGNTQNQPQICSDGAGGAIITWTDERVGASSDDIYAQKINPNGNVQWTFNGIVICNASGVQEKSQLCADGTGGAIIAWDDERTGVNDDDIYAQKIQRNPSSDWVTPISLAALASYGGLIEDITKMIEGFLSILLSPMVLGSIVLGQTFVIVILSSIIRRQRGTSGKREKGKRPKTSAATPQRKKPVKSEKDKK